MIGWLVAGRCVALVSAKLVLTPGRLTNFELIVRRAVRAKKALAPNVEAGGKGLKLQEVINALNQEMKKQLMRLEQLF